MVLTTYRGVYPLLKKSKNPILFIDARLDYDAWCSALGLALILQENFNSTPTISTIEETIPDRFRCNLSKFYDLDTVLFSNYPTQIDFSKHDLLISLDSADSKNINGYQPYQYPDGITSLNIDHHHEVNTKSANFNLVKPVSSTCSMVAKIAFSNKLSIPSSAASILIYGILTDSGHFSYDKVRPFELAQTAKLLNLSTKDLFYYTFNLNYFQSFEELLLQKIALNNFKLEKEYQFGWTSIDHSELLKEGIDPEYSFENYPTEIFRKLELIKFAVFLKQTKLDNSRFAYNVSLRSRLPDFDVSSIASKFGGGGHAMAAGFQLETKDPKEIIRKIIEIIRSDQL